MRRFVETLLALARQAHALLEQFQTLLQRQVAALQLAHHALQRLQRRFEIGSPRFRFLHNFMRIEARG